MLVSHTRHEDLCGIYMDTLITNKIVLEIKENVETMDEVNCFFPLGRFGWLQLVFN